MIIVVGLAEGQIDGSSDKSIFRGASGLTIGGVQQQWTLKDSTGSAFGTLSQQSAPVSVSVPLANRLLLSVANSGVISKFDTSSSTNIIDTRLSLSYVFPGEKLWLTGGIVFPTGKTELNASDLQLTNLLGQTAFGYKVPTFGQGLSSTVSMVYASSMTRRMVLGIGLSYFYKGKYKPISGSPIEYDPGDEFSLNIGYDYITFSKMTRLSFDVTSTYFYRDEISGSGAVFESGPRVIGTVIYSSKTETVNHTLLVKSRYRFQNYFITVDKRFDASLQIEGRYSAQTKLSESLVGTFIGEGKYYTADQIPSGISYIETGKAQIGSAGIDLSLVSWQTIVPTLGVRYALGTIVITGATYDISGIEARISLAVNL